MCGANRGCARFQNQGSCITPEAARDNNGGGGRGQNADFEGHNLLRNSLKFKKRRSWMAPKIARNQKLEPFLTSGASMAAARLWPVSQLPTLARVAIANMHCHSDPDWQLPDWARWFSCHTGAFEPSVSMCNCQNGHNRSQTGQNLLCTVRWGRRMVSLIY